MCARGGGLGAIDTMEDPRAPARRARRRTCVTSLPVSQNKVDTYEMGDGKRSLAPVTFLDQLLYGPNYMSNPEFTNYMKREKIADGMKQ